jgi:SAM-dependent methyltransferase
MGDHEQLDPEIAAHYASVSEQQRLGPWNLERVAALLFGPLYHLTDRADRVRALAEARRVLRPGGVLAAAAISRFASTCDGLLRGYLDEPGFEAIVERDVRDGQHRNPTGRPEWFTTAYFHLPEELGQEVTEAGPRLHTVFAVEGPAWMLPDIQRRLADPTRRERVLAAIRRIETEPSLLGASSHLLAVASR